MTRISYYLCCLGLMFLSAGCGEKPIVPSNQSPAEKTTSAESPYTHTLASETEYYTTGPQQSRPPDRTLTQGTELILVESAGSYTLVRSRDGIEAYIATDALNKKEQTE